ncbi:MAG: hypothetical protein E1N59_212 [Puniceicoccaceae bacterium 5H]|nr:MAG: hypothetical protein E1N59_212 [Puniceicoccaceae bacterium 5H]
MLKSYLLAALEQAHYQLEADGSIRGSVPTCPGVWARTGTLEQCRSSLETLLEQWILQRVWAHEPLPEINGQKLAVHVPGADFAPTTSVAPLSHGSAAMAGLTPEEEAAAIFALVGMMLDQQKHRIVSIRPVESAWSREGRRQIHASHRLR